MKKTSKIFVAGHRGMVGAACVRQLRMEGYENLLLRTRTEVDLRNREAVRSLYDSERPEYVIVAAAKVGGIVANNTQPVEFLLHNLEVQNNLIAGAYDFGVTKLLFLGSSCIYPKLAPQPIPESALLTGPLEPTNDSYAIAKIAGIKLCSSYARQYGARFISGMPTNLYGPEDNFDLQSSHVLPALLRKFHEAKANGSTDVTLWGTGAPRREFLYVDDLAEACLFLMHHYEDTQEHINIGSGVDLEIRELADLVRREVGYKGDIVWDTTKPDGTPRKLMQADKLLNLGWKAKTSLAEGVGKAYRWFLENKANRV